VAQPFAMPENATTSGIDTAGLRLEKAFQRLEAAVAYASANHHSLKVDHEKLNHLLCDSQEKMTRLKGATQSVSKRLDHTIDLLEGLE
jgi:exonuclease VII small subunit